MSKGCYVVVNGTTKKVKKKYVVVDGVTKKVKKKYVVVSQRTAPAVELPEGYVQLDYVESTGSQYVDTDFKPNQSTRVLMDVDVLSMGSSDRYLFGARVAYLNAAMYIASTSGNNSWHVGYADNMQPISDQCTGRHTIDYNQNSVAIDEVSHSFTVGTYAPNYNMLLFACSQAGTAIANMYAIMRLYFCKLYDNGTLVRNYIPCKNPSGTVGLYDTVNNNFVSSGTSIDLVAGTEQGNATRLVYEAVKPVASTAPASGVSYTNGLSGLTAAQVSSFAEAISNNTGITKDTSTVYIDSDEHYKLSIGDQVTLSLDGTNYAFDIIGFNHDKLTSATAYGVATATGRAGMTLQMHGVFNIAYPMNSSETTVGGWKGSNMRISTMARMKGYLPSAWQSVIKPTNKTSGVEGGCPNDVETVSDSCFLLAEIEVFGDHEESAYGEGYQYAYYKAGNSRVKIGGGDRRVWWERSPFAYNGDYFCCVGSYGSTGHGSANATGYYVAFAFCV